MKRIFHATFLISVIALTATGCSSITNLTHRHRSSSLEDEVVTSVKAYGTNGSTETSSWDEEDKVTWTQASKCLETKPVHNKEQHYFFAFDSSKVRGDYANDLIREHADYLLQHPETKIRIEGNADDRGSREYNIALAWRRARSIASILLGQGVPKNQMKVVSYGAERPATPGHSASARRCNRRVDLSFKKSRG